MRKIKTKYPLHVEHHYFSEIRDLFEESLNDIETYISSISKNKSSKKKKTNEELELISLLIITSNFESIKKSWNNKIDNYSFSSKANQLIFINKRIFEKQYKEAYRLKNIPENLNKSPKLQNQLLNQSFVFSTEGKQRLKNTGISAIDKIQVAVINAITNKTPLSFEEINQIADKTLLNLAFNSRDTLTKANGQIIKDIHLENNINKFEWTTMQDNRVRPSHEELEGKIFSYDNLPPEGLPGSEPNCRCVETPVFEDIEVDI